MGKILIALGGLSGLLSVAAGAFGAHALKKHLSADMLAIFETGNRYQMYHALALILIGMLARTRPSGPLHASGWSMVIGTLIFSGSLYALALSGQRWLGAITPIGGTAFLIGWGLLAYAALKTL